MSNLGWSAGLSDEIIEMAELLPSVKSVGMDEIETESGWTVWLDSEWAGTWTVADPEGEEAASGLTRDEALDVLRYRGAR